MASKSKQPGDAVGKLERSLADFRSHTEKQFVALTDKVNEIALNVAAGNAASVEHRVSLGEQRAQDNAARTDHETRLRTLEKSAWKLAGMGAAGAMAASVIAWGLGLFKKLP